MSPDSLAALANHINLMQDLLRREARARGLNELDLTVEPEDTVLRHLDASITAGPAERAVAAAQRALGLGVAEVRGVEGLREDLEEFSAKWIDDAIRSPEVGMGWSTVEYWAGGRRNIAYADGSKKFEWCGAATARFLREAGLDPHLAKYCLAGTGRLVNVSSDPDRIRMSETDIIKYRPDPARRIRPEDGQPGDVAVMGPVVGGKIALAHIELCVARYDGSITYDTIGGNTRGLRNGKPWRGVAMNTRPTQSKDDRQYRIAFFVRFGGNDFVR